MKNKKYTLITGASMGIGRAFAVECAQRGMNLLLVALPDVLLEEIKMQIVERYAVDVYTYGADLTHPTAVQDLLNYCLQEEINVSMLINNAGIGVGGKFENIPAKIYLNMMALNNQALVLLTYSFLPMLKKQPSAYILNLGSMEAFLPLPYKSVYTGTKNFIFAFSLALREELAPINIKVSVLCPGPVLTNPEGIKRMAAHGKPAKIMMLMPADVAKIGMDDLLKGKGVIVPGKINWTIAKVMKFFPTKLKMKLLERVFRVYKDH